MRRKQAAAIIRKHHALEPDKHRLWLRRIQGVCVAYITRRPLKEWQRVDQSIIVGQAATWEQVVRQCTSGFARSA